MKNKLLIIIICIVFIIFASNRYYFSKYEIENSIESIQISIAENMNLGNDSMTKYDPEILKMLNLPNTNTYVVLFQLNTNNYGHAELIKGINGKFLISTVSYSTGSNLIDHDEVNAGKINYFIIYGKNQYKMIDHILIESEYEDYSFTANVADEEIFLVCDEIPSSIEQAWPFYLTYFDKDGKIIQSSKTAVPVATEEIKDVAAEQDSSRKFSLKNFTTSQLQNIMLTEKDKDRYLFDNLLSTTEIISDNEAIFLDEYYKTVRKSSQALYCDGFDEGYNSGLIDTNISAMEFMYFDSSITDRNSLFASPYNLSKKDTTLVLEGNSDDLQVNVKDINYGYSIDNITLNCFIKKNTDDTFDVIIDPAYMHGLPVYHSDSKYCNYLINGINIKSDTLKLTVNDYKEFLYDTLMRLDSSYVYAQLTFDKFYVSYSINSGYNSTASINDYKLITKDTERVLTRAFLFENSKEKNPDMARVYNAMISNMNILNTDTTLGITLLDLDFDNIPEVLATRYSKNPEVIDESTNNEVADVDIYRIENENLIYIGTLYNYHRVIYELGNVLGLKTLEDGSKAWFNMSYKNRNTNEVSDTDYLFKLEGNELRFTEVFSKDNDGNYYYFGEVMAFDETPFYDERYGEKEEAIMYSWEDYKSIYGIWELIGIIKQGFCEDMKGSSFNLYSDWLSHTDPYEKSYKLPLTDRMLSYNIAYLVDSYYLGSYDSNKQYYEYRFLGDYAKPVIYLYPTEQTDVSVSINFNGILTCTYPEYDDGWNVTAYPDGTLINKVDGLEYSYLFWEGKGVADWDFSSGFVVKGSDTVKFMQEKLEYLGLNTREKNDFIVYWLPLMKHNKYNLITFQATAYENNAKLHIKPEPDSILRVFMAYKALDKYIDIPEQQLNSFNRNGFTVVEWGGTEAK